jgi:hypothetical protein
MKFLFFASVCALLNFDVSSSIIPSDLRPNLQRNTNQKLGNNYVDGLANQVAGTDNKVVGDRQAVVGVGNTSVGS